MCPSIRTRLSVWTGPLLLLLSHSALWAQSVPVDWGRLPVPGDRFEIHTRIVSEGTLTLANASPKPFRQSLQLHLFAQTVEEASRPETTAVRYSYESLALEFETGGERVRLEVTPTRVVLDGVALYDSDRLSDVPVSILTHLLNEPFVLEVGRDRRIRRLVERAKNRSEVLPLDLSEPVRETWVPLPPAPKEAGFRWGESSSRRKNLAGRLRVPATRTYEIVSAPGGLDTPLRISAATVSKTTGPTNLPTRLGWNLPHNLSYDALGPDLFSPPPPTQVVSFESETEAEIEYRLDWGFLSSRRAKTRIEARLLLPQPDGPKRLLRGIELNQTSETRVEKVALPDLGPEAKRLFLGG